MSMTPSPQTPGVPQWDLTDRLRKSLRAGGMSVQAMADHLEVHRKTISNYLSGHTNPSTATVRVWAMRCGVPFEWLARGVEAPESGPDLGMRQSSWIDGRPAQRLAPVVNLPLAWAS